MPQEPKRRHSKARKRTRRASIKLESIGLVKCSKCNNFTIPHQVCSSCGFYKGKQIKGIKKVQIVKA